MRATYSMGTRSLLRASVLGALILGGMLPAIAAAQQKSDYLLGEERGLEMVVHVLGEVTRPGEYRVPDDTNVLELLSKAGGGTQLARLSGVTITRLRPSAEVASSASQVPSTQRMFLVNIEHILQGKTADVPVLQPGDVVTVPRNSWSAWRTTAAVLRDLSIVATTYFLAVRTYED